MDSFTLGLLIGYSIYGVVFGAICRWLAIQKNRNGSNWFIVGFFLGFLGLMVIGFSPTSAPAQKGRRNAPQGSQPNPPSFFEQVKSLYATDRLKFVSISALLTALVLWALPLDISTSDWSELPFGLQFDGLLAGGCGSMGSLVFDCYGYLGSFNFRSDYYAFFEGWTLEVYAAAMLVFVSAITFVLRLSNRQKS